MQAIQLNLWDVEAYSTPKPKKETSVPGWAEDYNPCPRGTINSTMTLDPCPSCPLKDLCSSDDCGMKLYELDDNEENYYPFTDWLTDPLY